MNSRTSPALLIPLLLLACGKDRRGKPLTDDTGPGPDTVSACDTGHLDVDGECVPAACGTGTWGNLEVDESTVHVDISSAEGGDGSQAAPFTSIQEGLDAAGDADGGMVAVAAGTYPETLELGRTHDDLHLAGRCRELVVIDASAGDESTPGIHVDTSSSEVEVSGVTVNGSRYFGVLVGSGNMAMRACAVTESEYVGVAAFQAGMQTTALTLEGCEVRGNTGWGVFVAQSGTSVTLRETSIEDTLPDGNGEHGYGLEVQDGASLDAEDCEVRGNTTGGVFAIGLGTSVALRGTSFEDTKPDEIGGNGFGIVVQDGASLDAQGCQVKGNTSAGVAAANTGTSVTLRETTIEDTEPDDKGVGGCGIGIMDGASLFAEDCEVRRNANLGVVGFDSGTSVTLRELTIEDTLPAEDGEFGYGIQVYGGASLDAEGCVLRRNTNTAVIAFDPGTSVALLETTIEDTLPDEKVEGGYGIDVSEGASLDAEACVVRGSSTIAVGARGSGTSITLRETTIEDTLPNDDGEFGYGIYVEEGASLDADGCAVRGNAAAGVYIAQPGSSVTMLGTSIEDTRPDDNGDFGYGIEVQQGASLDAETCLVRGNSAVGLVAAHSGTSVTLRETSVEDSQTDEDGDGGYGIEGQHGASVDAENCEVGGNTVVGVLALDSGTSVTLQGTRIANTKRGETYTVGLGVVAQREASVVAIGVEVSSNEGPGIFLVDKDTYLTCSECVVRDNQFAGAVVVCEAALGISGSFIEGSTEQENIGGGVGIYAEPWLGGPPFLSVTDTTIQDNAISGVWLSGQGSYSFSDNAIHGGEGWSRESLTKCGDAVYAGEGVTAWDGSAGLLLENNDLLDGLGAGLILDGASATLSGNHYADNDVDLITQGASCATLPEGYENETIGSAEICPTHDYATCGDEFSLVLTLAKPESGHGLALPGLTRAATSAAVPRAFDPVPALSSGPPRGEVFEMGRREPASRMQLCPEPAPLVPDSTDRQARP